MRELSNRCRELWAMRAINETSDANAQPPDPRACPVRADQGVERSLPRRRYVLPADADAPVAAAADWLKEHLRSGFERAWSNPVQNVYPGSGSGAGQWQSLFVDHPPSEFDDAIKVKALSRWVRRPRIKHARALPPRALD